MGVLKRKNATFTDAAVRAVDTEFPSIDPWRKRGRGQGESKE